MATEKARLFLAEAIEKKGCSYADLSRLIGRNPAYIQQFIKRGTPRRLDEQDRRTIARYLDVSEHLLSGLQSPVEAHSPSPCLPKSVLVPTLALGASAGAGTLDVEENAAQSILVDTRWLRRIGAHHRHISFIQVDGESMAPTLGHGDDILVDHSDGRTKVRDGIYVLRLDDVLMVKRVATGPRRGRFSILSDNILYPSWNDLDPETVTIVGRVVWVGRTLR